MITKRQKQIFNYIKKFIIKNEYAPSLEEIKEHFSLKSVSTIHQHIKALETKGFIKKFAHQHRNIEINNKQKSNLKEILLIGLISCGEPIEPIANPETIQVPYNMFSEQGEYYALRAKGGSMIEDGILNGDVIIVRKQSIVENGENAVIYLPDKNEVTLKKFFREKNRIRLQPANKKMKPFYEKKIEIQGKFVGVLRKII